jgi:hypothetical protein
VVVFREFRTGFSALLGLLIVEILCFVLFLPEKILFRTERSQEVFSLDNCRLLTSREVDHHDVNSLTLLLLNLPARQLATSQVDIAIDLKSEINVQNWSIYTLIK